VINSRLLGQFRSMGRATLAVATEAPPARAVSDVAPAPADDARRLRELLDAHYDFIWRALRRLGVDDRGADDAAQQVFVIASRKLAGIRAGGERGYLFGIAVRVASDARRASSRRREQPWEHAGDPADPTPSADEILDQRRARALLDEALAKLPMDLRVVFTLHELEEMSMSEIAELAGIAPGTVASRLRRARESFEEIVARLGRGRGGGR
jgi:RNA polymerase sigma-70 factor (ECF subfamily)